MAGPGIPAAEPADDDLLADGLAVRFPADQQALHGEHRHRIGEPRHRRTDASPL